MYIVYSKTLCLDKTSLVIGAKLQRQYRYFLLYYYTRIGQHFSHGNTCTLHWVNYVYLLFTCIVPSCIVIIGMFCCTIIPLLDNNFHMEIHVHCIGLILFTCCSLVVYDLVLSSVVFVL